MVRTYIFGTPKGYDFYENDNNLTEYFKSQYISSRKGKRLLVSRTHGGVTIYNYLRYGLLDEGGRPNAFFGMALLTDDGTFTPKFTGIYEWFDYIFDKIVEHGVIFKQYDKSLQYAISKFSNAVKEIEWIKSNLPNIFSSKAGTEIRGYDNTFSVGFAAEIPCFNISVNEDKILSSFKRYNSIMLSPDLSVEDVTLDWDGLNKKVNAIKDSLLYNISGETLTESHYSLLKQYEGEVSNCIKSIKNYTNKFSSHIGEDERNNASTLYGEYYKCLEKIYKLLNSPTVSGSPAVSVDPAVFGGGEVSEDGKVSGNHEISGDGKVSGGNKVPGHGNKTLYRLGIAVIIIALLIIGVVLIIKPNDELHVGGNEPPTPPEVPAPPHDEKVEYYELEERFNGIMTITGDEIISIYKDKEFNDRGFSDECKEVFNGEIERWLDSELHNVNSTTSAGKFNEKLKAFILEMRSSGLIDFLGINDEDFKKKWEDKCSSFISKKPITSKTPTVPPSGGTGNLNADKYVIVKIYGRDSKEVWTQEVRENETIKLSVRYRRCELIYGPGIKEISYNDNDKKINKKEDRVTFEFDDWEMGFSMDFDTSVDRRGGTRIPKDDNIKITVKVVE